MTEPTGLRDIEHLIRPAILAVIGIVVFLVVRSALVPADFGVYGYFRAGALDDIRAQPMRYAGRAACVECHDDVAAVRAGGAHEQVGCEACHGPLAAHAVDPMEVAVELPDPGTLCVRCHALNGYRPATFPQVVAADHAMDEPCNACHEPHSPGL